ncbi:Predicted acetyltransferase, GNAT family [Pararobbsia alpina]|uniref:GNAT family N-acetyltransferase n=1 Tax=Pararobbsia alpina TaxID=621374 RepID=UPI0039A50C1B
MSHTISAALDNPVWSALTMRQGHLGQSAGVARRYLPDVAPFAGIEQESEAAFDRLRELVIPDEALAVLSKRRLDPIDGLQLTYAGALHQMVAVNNDVKGTDTHDVIRLTRTDVPDMLDLARRTKPGPFAKRTQEMGSYIGIRNQGRLVAMAGERMHLDGYVEISAVCVDDSWRGKGIAGRLMNILRVEIAQRGEIPFLHVFKHNTTAVALYERLGFEVHRTFELTRLSRAA